MIYDSRDILKNILYIGYGNTHQNITIVETKGISQEKKWTISRAGYGFFMKFNFLKLLYPF